MQNIGLEMRKCVAGRQKMGLQAPNTKIARESGRTFDEGGRRVSTKEAARSEKAGATRSQLDLSRRKAGAHSARGGRVSTKEAANSEKAGANAARRGKKSAALHGGVRREGWFCGDRRRSA